MEEEFKKVDLITLLRTFKREGISNFVVIRKEKFENNFISKSKVKEKIEELNNVDNKEALEDIMNRQNYTITELVQFVLREILKEKNSD